MTGASPTIPAFRADIVECGRVDGQVLLADPLTGSYFTCGPLEDAVRTALREPMPLGELLDRVRRSACVPVGDLPSARAEHRELEVDDLRAIVDTFAKHSVLEPTLDDLADPGELADIIARVPRCLARRGVDQLVPTQASSISPADARRRCEAGGREGRGAISALSDALAADSAMSTPVRAELELAVRLAWMQHIHARQHRGHARRLLGFLCFRVPILKHGIPGLDTLARHLSGPILIVAAGVVLSVWAAAALSISRGGWSIVASPSHRLHAATLVELIVTVPFVVLLHELAHALTCARLGGRVREFGLLVLVGNVLPYVDVSDAWALPRGRRIAISFAGSISDLTFAAVAVVLIDQLGLDRSALPARLLSAAASIALLSLVLNLNPLLRFDGYFVLCDLLAVPNIRSKSLRFVYSAVARALGNPGPRVEPASRRDKVLFAAYGFAVLVMLGVAVGILIRGPL